MFAPIKTKRTTKTPSVGCSPLRGMNPGVVADHEQPLLGFLADDAAFVDQLLNPGDAVVVGLDQVRLSGSSGLDGIRIDRALTKNPVAVEVVFAFENPLLNFDEFLADDVALFLGTGDSRQRAEETFARVFHEKRPRTERGEILADKFRLTFAHQAAIHVRSMNAIRSKRLQAKRVRNR